MKRLSKAHFWILICAALGVFALSASAQNRRNQRPAAQPAPTPQQSEDQHKKNSRPEIASKDAAAATITPTHFFEYSRPGFTVSRIVIEHDDAGAGKVSFDREGFQETISDSFALSPVTVKGIAEALERMSFLDSVENYQYENDMPHLGNNTFTLKRAGKQRTVKYNWTTNKDARFLIDEYRKIGNALVWRFELASARENQPLQTPKLLTNLESLIRRKEISDPPHLVPLLTELVGDERVPLMARNTAERIIKQIEKSKKR